MRDLIIQMDVGRIRSQAIDDLSKEKDFWLEKSFDIGPHHFDTIGVRFILPFMSSSGETGSVAIDGGSNKKEETK